MCELDKAVQKSPGGPRVRKGPNNSSTIIVRKEGKDIIDTLIALGKRIKNEEINFKKRGKSVKELDVAIQGKIFKNLQSHFDGFFLFSTLVQIFDSNRI